MRFKHPLVQKALGLATALGLRLLRTTIDWRAVYFDPAVDTVHPQFIGRCVFAGWHEFMLMPIALRGRRRMLALASDHGDGEVISLGMQHLGWGVVRGSTSRGSVAALLRLLRDEDSCIPNLTPDGPRGPRRQLALGPIFLACKLGLPFVCVGYGFDRPLRMRSWDRFAVPRPFSRARAVFGPPLRIPPKLDREGLESHRRWFEQLLNWLTEEAEAWAESGARRAGEMRMLPGEAPRAMQRQMPAAAFTLPDRLIHAWAALGNSFTDIPTRRRAG
jgi:lysophospholipid acyltransferase (LPLAT)-like uncharacterized protein